MSDGNTDIGPCIEWTACRSKAGYGKRRHKGKDQYVHRLAYCEYHGLTLDDIQGVVIRHKCDNPPCFNPRHLERGTHADNMHDKIRRGRANVPVGARNCNAKLTDETVRTIRTQYVRNSREFGCYALARKFGVTPRTVFYILAGSIWKHVEPAQDENLAPSAKPLIGE
jgi:hypothetical protein